MNLLKKYAPDSMIVAGAVAVSYGAWLVYDPAGFIVAGLLMAYAGLRLA